MKRSWPQYWPKVYELIKQAMRSSLRQFLTGEMIFKILLQEIDDKVENSRLSLERQRDLRAVGFLFFSVLTLSNLTTTAMIS